MKTCDPDKTTSAYCLFNPPPPKVVEALGTCGPALAATFQRAAAAGASWGPTGPDGMLRYRGKITFVHLGQLRPAHAHAVAAAGQPAEAIHATLLGDHVSMVMHGPRAYLNDDKAALDPDFKMANKAEAGSFWKLTRAVGLASVAACPPATPSLTCAAKLDEAGAKDVAEDVEDVGGMTSAPAFGGLARKHAQMIASLYSRVACKDGVMIAPPAAR